MSNNPELTLQDYRLGSFNDMGIADKMAYLEENGGGATLSVAAFGATGDGSTDDTVAIQAAITEALSADRPLYFPAGTYALTNQGSQRCLTVSGSNLRIIGDNATLVFDSLTTHCFYVATGVQNLLVEGLRFQGSTLSDDGQTGVQLGGGLNVAANVQYVTVTRCHFNHCAPAIFASSETSGELIFTDNVMVDTPLPLSPPPSSLIANNFWHNTEVVTVRSHCIYAYGRVDRCVITGNSFQNTTDATIEIRANDAWRLQKREWIISDNMFENSNSYGMFISDLSSSIDVGTLVVSNNVFKNVGGPIELIGVRDAVIEGNVMEWDYEYGYASPNQGVAATSTMSTGENASRGLLIANNKVVNRHPYWAQVTFGSIPSDGDTITVGSTVYTWKTTPTVAGHLQIGVSVDSCAAVLVAALRGNDGRNSFNTTLREVADAWMSQYASEGKAWIASRATFTLSRTGTAVSVSSVTDAHNVLENGVSVAICAFPKIAGNHIEGGGIAVTDCVSPTIEHNTLVQSSNQPAAINSTGNAFPVFDGNRLVWDQTVASPEAQGDRWLNSYDAFPVIRNCEILANQNGAVAKLLPWLQGQAGYVKAGDGKAKTYLYYGHENNTDQTSSQWYHWSDGDQVGLYDAASTVFYFFTFKRVGPNGTTEFNSYATLMALINTQTAGRFTASNPVVDFYGSDALAYGYIEIKAAAVGTTGNGNVLIISRKARTCGVYLRAWVDGGVYANKSQTQFFGGAATATKTVVYTPLASVNTPMFVQGYDATSEALAPKCYAADTVPGVAYVITHTVAAGTEKFFWKVG